MDTSSESGAPAMPSRLVATKRRGETAGSAITRLNDRAAMAPPGESRHGSPVASLGRTLRAWKAQILAYFDTHGVSNGGTEAINLIIEKVRRLAHGFKDFDHYRLRILLAADGSRPYRKSRNHP